MVPRIGSLRGLGNLQRQVFQAARVSPRSARWCGPIQAAGRRRSSMNRPVRLAIPPAALQALHPARSARSCFRRALFARTPGGAWGNSRRRLLKPRESRRAGQSELRKRAFRAMIAGMFTLAVMAVALSTAPAEPGGAAWGKLQRGMNATQVAQLVGVPLLRNAARGHELWVYDAGAHIQFHGGALSAWSAPAAKPRAAAPRAASPAGVAQKPAGPVRPSAASPRLS